MHSRGIRLLKVCYFAIINECFLLVCGGLESNPMTSGLHVFFPNNPNLGTEGHASFPVSSTIALATIFVKFLTFQGISVMADSITDVKKLWMRDNSSKRRQGC